mgnify:CR=1 FL=1
MSEFILLVFYCALLGSVVGFLAGLLGIGGGLVIVPILSIILLHFNFRFYVFITFLIISSYFNIIPKFFS